MTTAASVLIDQVSCNSKVGIVEFATSAHTLSNIRVVDSEWDRRCLKDMLPVSAKGSTAIGQGIMKGIEVNKINLLVQSRLIKM